MPAFLLAFFACCIEKGRLVLGDLGRKWERIQVTAEECPRIPREFLEEERAAMGDRWFLQEYLCEFEDSVSGVFDRELVERAITYEWSLWHTGRPRWTGTS